MLARSFEYRPINKIIHHPISISKIISDYSDLLKVIIDKLYNIQIGMNSINNRLNALESIIKLLIKLIVDKKFI